MTTAADVNWSLVNELDNLRRKVHSLEAQIDGIARSCLSEREGRLKAEATLRNMLEVGVTVPRATLARVIEIAGRNEAAPEIVTLRAALSGTGEEQ